LFGSQAVHFDNVSYNAAISACDKGMLWELALTLLNECKIWSTPNGIKRKTFL